MSDTTTYFIETATTGHKVYRSAEKTENGMELMNWRAELLGTEPANEYLKHEGIADLLAKFNVKIELGVSVILAHDGDYHLPESFCYFNGQDLSKLDKSFGYECDEFGKPYEDEQSENEQEIPV